MLGAVHKFTNIGAGLRLFRRLVTCHAAGDADANRVAFDVSSRPASTRGFLLFVQNPNQDPADPEKFVRFLHNETMPSRAAYKALPQGIQLGGGQDAWIPIPRGAAGGAEISLDIDAVDKDGVRVAHDVIVHLYEYVDLMTE